MGTRSPKDKIKPRGVKDAPTKSKKVHYAEVDSASGNSPYTVTWTEDGHFKCQCKGFVFRDTCKHIRKIQNMYGWNK